MFEEGDWPVKYEIVLPPIKTPVITARQRQGEEANNKRLSITCAFCGIKVTSWKLFYGQSSLLHGSCEKCFEEKVIGNGRESDGFQEKRRA